MNTRARLGRIKRAAGIHGRDCLLHLSGAYRQSTSVSLCTGVKNRLEHLQQTVLKNLQDNHDYPSLEIVLVNYNCPNPETEAWVKGELSEYMDSGRLSYYFYPDTPTYRFAHAKNLAYRLAKGDILCNVDADNFTGPGFARFISAQLHDQTSFVAGPRDGRGLAGRIAIRREHFELTGGYDERIVDWGGDDYEFTRRLNLLGLECRPIFKERFLRSIKHSDSLRTRYSEFDDKWATHEINSRIREQNLDNLAVNPNGEKFGRGKVLKNFREWVEV